MDDQQQHDQYLSVTTERRQPQHLQAIHSYDNHESKRRPLVLTAAATSSSSHSSPINETGMPSNQRRLRFAQQPITPAAPLHNLRDWMHLPTPPTAAKSSSNAASNSSSRQNGRMQYGSNNSHRPSPLIVPSLLNATDQGSIASTPSFSHSSSAAPSTPPACTLAEQAPASGYLLKVAAATSSDAKTRHDQATPTTRLKRRYFILQPGTFLYDFLSDQDTVPRGCLDLEGSWLQEEPPDEGNDVHHDDSGFRFSVNWTKTNQKVILQAPDEVQGRAWMEALETMRLDYAQQLLFKQSARNSALTSRVRELEQQVRNFKLVEEEKDLAMHDAIMWKQKMEVLDENVRKLSLLLLRQSRIDNSLAKGEKGNADGFDLDEKHDATNDTLGNSREISLFDNEVSSHEFDEDETRLSIDAMAVPGQHFPSLYNACEMMRDNVRLAANEATTAVQDLHAANEKVEAIEKRMLKAEKHLCKIWEENCALRKELKMKKQEKKVLVKEVLTLRTLASSGTIASVSEQPSVQNRERNDEDISSDAAASASLSEEEKLINELENHVLSSIRLHEQMLMAGSGLTPSGHVAVDEDGVDDISGGNIPASAQIDQLARHGETNNLLTRRTLPVASLFDNDGDSHSGSGEVQLDRKGELLAASISSTAVETSDGEDDFDAIHQKPLEEVDISASSHASTPERPNPLNQLDVDTPDKMEYFVAEEVSRPGFTYDKATSRIACPLADVIGTRKTANDIVSKSFGTDELQVYHLTFYSQKIGLQFQKIPPPPAKSNGLLTDAIKADMKDERGKTTRTAEELRRIAAISSSTKRPEDNANVTCPLAQPVHAVIVCGFEGFDESGSNIRPRLGARLVAFDGVSVEVGKWTFESIRKAIKARERPLTLSFRNDFLTTEQRSILTRAIREVAAKGGSQKLKRTVPMHTAPVYTHRRRPSIDPSVQSCITYESDPFPLNHSTFQNDDDWSVSVGGGSEQHRGTCKSSTNVPQSFSAGRSFASSVDPRSFSEAGSSTSAIMSAVGPLVTSLLSRSQRSKEPFSPDFLRRPPASVENTPQHADFCSELL